MKSLHALAACLALLATGPALAQTHKLKLGHASSAESSQQVALVKFAELVKERSKGEVEITVYPGSTLGPDAQLINLTRGGSIDIAVSGSTKKFLWSRNDTNDFSRTFLLNDKNSVSPTPMLSPPGFGSPTPTAYGWARTWRPARP